MRVSALRPMACALAFGRAEVNSNFVSPRLKPWAFFYRPTMWDCGVGGVGGIPRLTKPPPRQKKAEWAIQNQESFLDLRGPGHPRPPNFGLLGYLLDAT